MSVKKDSFNTWQIFDRDTEDMHEKTFFTFFSEYLIFVHCGSDNFAGHILKAVLAANIWLKQCIHLISFV